MKRLRVPGQKKRRDLRCQAWQDAMLADVKDLYKEPHDSPCAVVMAVMWNNGGVAMRARGGTCDIIGLIENAKIQFVNALLGHE